MRNGQPRWIEAGAGCGAVTEAEGVGWQARRG